jgi:small GTP-binding protein
MGDTGVGKSSLVTRYIKNTFNEGMIPTIGVEFACKIVETKDKSKLKVQIFDTAGQEKYRSIVSNYCRKALGCLLVYDITNFNTFEVCKQFKDQIKQIAEPDCTFILVGNKSDLNDDRKVDANEAKNFALENEMYFIETSAKNNEKVHEAFQALFDRVAEENKKKVNYENNKNDFIKIEDKNETSKNFFSGNTKEESCC